MFTTAQRILILLAITALAMTACFAITTGQEQDIMTQQLIRRNLVTNGSFEDGFTDWSRSRLNLSAIFDNTSPEDGGTSLRLTKTDSSNYSIRQTISAPMLSGRTYTLSARVKNGRPKRRRCSHCGNRRRLALGESRSASYSCR